jgi:hypothetical protein
MILFKAAYISNSPDIRNTLGLTSFSKFALVNSKEFNSALVAASLTWSLGSSRFIPCTIAVSISFDVSSKHLCS